MRILPKCYKAIAFWCICQGLAAAPVDYVKEVKPLLADNCYSCHGANAQKSGLRVDTAALAIKGGDDGPAIAPGKGSDSLMVKALLGTAKDIHRMPLKKPPLADESIAMVRQWIDEGASAPLDEKPELPHAVKSKHWSFVAPVRPVEPEVKQKNPATQRD